MMQTAEMEMSRLLPNTQYFEFASKVVGSTLAVWVTTPSGYDPDSETTYPAIFTPDGNLMAPISIPFTALLSGGISGGDVVNPIRPYIQVTIGYCGVEDITYRLRDLLPRGEPVPGFLKDVADSFVAAGHWSADFAAESLARLRDAPAAEAFLAFLTDELYPEVTARWRVDPATTGFFGDSYGGLFAVWLALQRVKQFPIVGAGSPGIPCAESKVFEVLASEQANDADHSGRHLHFSYPVREFEAPTYFQAPAEQYVRFLALLAKRPLKGLKLTTHMVSDESHITGLLPNFFSFLRTCYAGK